MLPPYIRIRAGTAPTDEMEVARIMDPVIDARAGNPCVVTLSTGGGDAARQFIDMSSALWEQMLYPIAFPTGVGGWHRPIGTGANRVAVASTSGATLTFHRYMHAMIFQYWPWAAMGLLAQCWVLDAYSRWQSINFRFLRCGDTQRSISVRSVDFEVPEAGRTTFLPACTPGSDQYQKDLIADGMALVAWADKPTLFITFTANPKWRELTEALEPGQSIADRPDLVMRVFYAKLLDLTKDLREGRTFVAPYLYILRVIEFQVRVTCSRLLDFMIDL